jgi:UDP-N-acetylglucosamine 3-dehydrogenase
MQANGVPISDQVDMTAENEGVVVDPACSGPPALHVDEEKHQTRREKCDHGAWDLCVALVMERIRVGVVGAGFMGERHARILASLADVNLVAVCDTRSEAAGRVAGLTGAQAWTDSEALLARGGLDAVVICTPDAFHRAPCEAAAGAGVHVLLEKPIATTVADAEAIVAACRSAGVVLLVGHCLRFDARYDQVRSAIAAGEVGEVQTVYTRRANTVAAQDRLGGRCSLPLFLGVHDYDVMRWLAGSEVTRVSAESKWGFLRSQGFPVEDANCALLRFESGALGIAELNWILPRGFPAGGDHRAEVVGSRGALHLATLETGLRRSDAARSIQVDTTSAPLVQGHAGGMFYWEMRHFLDCVRGRARPLVTPHDAVMALRVALAVERAAADGGAVAP